MMNLGDFPTGAMIDFKWNAFSGLGASITRSTDGAIRIYKANSVTQRSSAAGITDTEDFDSLTGLNHLRIDLSDNTDAGFYAAGSEYQVVLQGAVIDGQTVNAVLAHFSIERAGGFAAILARLPSSLVSGRIDASVGAMAANTLTATAIATDALTAAKFASGAFDAVWSVATRVLTAATNLGIAAADIRTALGFASANFDTQLADLPTNAELATSQASADDATLAAIAALTIPTANQNADALLDRAAGVETGLTVRQAFRLAAAALFGKASGLAGTTATYRDTNDGVNRIVATVDADGNRSAVTLDAS